MLLHFVSSRTNSSPPSPKSRPWSRPRRAPTRTTNTWRRGARSCQLTSDGAPRRISKPSSPKRARLCVSVPPRGAVPWSGPLLRAHEGSGDL